MADIRGKKILVIGGAGFIGSHVVDELLKEDVEQVIVYDNFARGARGSWVAGWWHDRPERAEIVGDFRASPSQRVTEGIEEGSG